MALIKSDSIDKIEILADGHVQVRTATRIIEDGVVISCQFNRHVVAPGDDVTNEHERVKMACQTFHTKDVVDAYNAKPKDKKEKGL